MKARAKTITRKATRKSRGPNAVRRRAAPAPPALSAADPDAAARANLEAILKADREKHPPNSSEAADDFPRSPLEEPREVNRNRQSFEPGSWRPL